MNLRTTGLLLLFAMLLIGFVGRDLLQLDIPRWVSIVLMVLGIVALGIHSYQQKTFKKYVLMHFVYLLIFIVLIFIQFECTP
jgi:Flp pilus assembly protein protease CpaA